MSMPTSDQPGKAYYEIIVTLIGEQVTPVIPDPLEFGKTVRYKSDDGTGKDAGKVRITFLENGSPYLNPDGSSKLEVSSNDPPLRLSKEGQFTGRCYITTPGGEEMAGVPNIPQPVAIMM